MYKTVSRDATLAVVNPWHNALQCNGMKIKTI